jgi:hypothetical protein
VTVHEKFREQRGNVRVKAKFYSSSGAWNLLCIFLPRHILHAKDEFKG